MPCKPDPRLLTVFPTPLSGETVFSMASWFHLLRVNRIPAFSLKELFDTTILIPASGLPSHLGNLAAKVTPILHGADEYSMIERHTLYPYFAPFLSTSQARFLRKTMAGPSGGGIKMGIGLVESRIGASDPLRMCPECVSDDIATVGRPYWHRAHQLPGVQACYIHGAVLVENRNNIMLKERHMLFLPEVSPDYERFPHRSPSGHMNFEPCKQAIRFASWSRRLLEAKFKPISPKKLCALYREQLQLLGFTTPKGRIRQRRLVDQVLRIHNQFEYLPQGNYLRKIEGGVLPWLAKLVRKHRNSQHPLKHLLLIMTIFETWEAFAEAVDKPRRKPIQHKLAPSVIQTGENRIRELFEKGTCSLRQTAKQFGCSVNTVAVWAARAGIKLKLRPKNITEEMKKGICVCLIHGDPIQDIASAFGVSVASVGRINRSSREISEKRIQRKQAAEYFRRIKSIRQRVHSLGLSDRQSIRKACGGDITWFRRHNPNWLSKFLVRFPPTKKLIRKTRINWDDRDRELEGGLRKAIEGLRHQPGKPVRITAVELGRRCNRIHWLQKKLHLLPRCQKLLSLNIESRCEFRLRRVRWAAEELQCESSGSMGWRLRRLAGIGINEELSVSILIDTLSKQKVSEMDEKVG